MENISSSFKVISITVILKILSIISLILFSISLLITWNTPATGYEISIYNSTPSIFWISIFICIILGIIHIIYFIYNNKNDFHWKLGLFFIYIAHITCLSTYIIRDYYAWNINGDTGTHLGIISQSLTQGFIDQTIYPIIYLYSIEFIKIINLGIHRVDMFILLCFCLLYLPFMFVLARTIFNNKLFIILTTVFSAFFLSAWQGTYGWHLYFIPNILANIFLPLAIYILIKYLKTQKKNWLFLLLLILFFYPLFHPLTAFIFLLICIFIQVPQILYEYKNKTNIYKIKNSNLLLIIIFSIWYIIWLSSFWNGQIINLANLLMGNYGSSHYYQLLSNINYANYYGYNVINIILNIELISIIFVLISLACIPIIIKDINKEDIIYLYSLYGPFFIIGILLIIFYIINLGFGPLRIFEYILIISTIFMGYACYKIFSSIKMIRNKLISNIFIILLAFIILLMFIGSISTLYPSPTTLSLNTQTTYSQLLGMKWLLTKMNMNSNISSLYLTPIRFYDYFSLDVQNRHLNEYLKTINIPNHFNYNNIGSINTYLITTKMDELSYEELYPTMAKYRFEQSDFENLSYKNYINKLYTNGEFDNWYVN